MCEPLTILANKHSAQPHACIFINFTENIQVKSYCKKDFLDCSFFGLLALQNIQ